MCVFFFCKQQTAYEMRISDWSSDVCSSDLIGADADWQGAGDRRRRIRENRRGSREELPGVKAARLRDHARAQPRGLSRIAQRRRQRVVHEVERALRGRGQLPALPDEVAAVADMALEHAYTQRRLDPRARHRIEPMAEVDRATCRER